MAKYNVSHACGHDQTHLLFGRTKDRDRQLKWLKTTLCSDCWREEQDKQREKESKVAASTNAAAGLPELQGSPKQIAWAESIRSKFLSNCTALCEKARAYHPTEDQVPRHDLEVALLEDYLVLRSSESSSRFWIDTRTLLETKGSILNDFVRWIREDRPDAAAILNPEKVEG